MKLHSIANLWTLTSVAFVSALGPRDGGKLAKCPGYKASNVKTTCGGVKADLHLAGPPCNAYGKDLDNLKLDVTVETTNRVHVKIYDAKNQVYQVPESVFPRPKPGKVDKKKAALKFDFKENPFSFRIIRAGNNEVLFDSSAAGLVIEDQYLRMRTKLPTDTNLYGLGEHSDSFRLQTTNYTLTIWNADTPSIPNNANLYGSHPVYLEHRPTGSHGVFLLNSNGMDVFIDKDKDGQYLEYNTLGGVFDFYFMAGPTPIDVTKQYSEIAGLPVMVPYSGLGFHQCRWGYQDAFDVAEVVYNYSKAEIPLETMWTDIDYMDGRSIFSVDPERFPMKMVREIVDHLHRNKQKYTVMVDPAVAARDYPPYQRGLDADAFILNDKGETFHGVVWPGLTAYPDWFSKNAQSYWNKEFSIFFSPKDGVDIDFLWIDMNEPSNFCDFPCVDPVEAAKEYPPKPPPVRAPPRPLPGWSCDFQPPGTDCKRDEQTFVAAREEHLVEARDVTPIDVREAAADDDGRWKGLPGRELIDPPYKIHNIYPALPQKTINTSLAHHNGLVLYDTHNLYGSMMSVASREAMLMRRPSKRPLVITRSTFAGAGAHVSHWLGDNDSDWPHYHWSIRGMLQFNSIFQVSMVGSDVCGFNGNVTEELCSRWAMLGAFQPFYRNHNAEGQIAQEFYRWQSTTEAARKAIDIRYRLLDYLYTALQKQSVDGTPALNPMFYLYPHDSKTYGVELQYFYGPSLLVAPVTEAGATSVDIYLPDDIFYDFYTHEQIKGEGKAITKSNQKLTDIPLFYRGGVIVPQRVKSAMTTADLREENFELVVAVGKDGTAEGNLYLDDGESLKPDATSNIIFKYDKGHLNISGDFGYKTKARISRVTLLGVEQSKMKTASSPSYIPVNQPLTGDSSISL